MTVNIQMHKIHQSIGLIHKNLECSVCLEILEDPVSTKCGHQFCRFCILAVLQTKPTAPCPLCKKVITKRGLTDNKRLKEIVAAVSTVTTAIEQDSGTKCSPPRGAVILSQCSQPTSSPDQSRQNQKKSKKPKSTTRKKNLRQSKPKCTSSLEIFIDGDNDNGDDIQMQEPSRSNINISNSFPAPSKASSRNNQKDRGKEDSLLAAFKRAPLRPTSEDVENVSDGTCLRIDNGISLQKQQSSSKQMTNGLLDPYEFIPSQRTPKKKTKRQGVRKTLKSHGNASKLLPPRSMGKTVANQMKESRKEKMKIVVDKIDVHMNGDNKLEDDWNGKEMELNIVNDTKKQADTPLDNGTVHEFDLMDLEQITEQCLDIEGQNVNEENQTMEIDRIDVKEDVMNESEHSDNKEKESTYEIDGEINDVQLEEVHQEQSGDDEGREECEDRPQKMLNNEEGGMLFKKVYPVNHFRKTELPQNQGSKSTSGLPVMNRTCLVLSPQQPNDPVTEEVTTSKESGTEKLSRRKKMQKTLQQFGTSEEGAKKNTHRIATRKNDKSDWEIAIELAQVFGTLPKELQNKGHSSRKVKPKVDIHGAAKHSTEKTNLRKARGRKSLLTQDNSVSDEYQIQEFSDSSVERKSYSLRNSQNNKVPSATTDSDHNKKCEDQQQTRSTKATKETDEKTSNNLARKPTNASPRGPREPNVVPETPLIPIEEKESAKNILEEFSPKQIISGEKQAGDHPENVDLSITSEGIADEEQVIQHLSGNSDVKVHKNKELRRSKRQSITKSPQSNDSFNLECTKKNSSGQRSKRICSNTYMSDAVNEISKDSIDQSTSLENSHISNETNTATNKREQCNSQIKNRLRRKSSSQKEALCNSDKPTSCTGLLTQQETSMSGTSEGKMSEREAVDQGQHCDDQKLATCIDGDTTDSIELSVSDIEYEEPSIVVSEVKDTSCQNDDESHTEHSKGKNRKGTREDEMHHETAGNVLPLVSDAECLKGNEDLTGFSEETLLHQCSRGSTKKSRRSLNSQKFLGNDRCHPEKGVGGNNTQCQESPLHEKLQKNSDECLNKREKPIAAVEDKSVMLTQNHESRKQPRRSKRKTFALGNTPEKVHCQDTAVTTEKQMVQVLEGVQSSKENIIKEAQRNGCMDYKSKQEMSPESRSAEMFSDETLSSEVVNINLIHDDSAALKVCNNATSNDDNEAKLSKESVIPPSSLEFNMNSDLFSDADQVSSSLSSRRKSRGLSSRRVSQSARRSPRISGNLSTNSSTGHSENILVNTFESNLVSMNVNRMAENEIRPEFKVTGDVQTDFSRAVRRSQTSSTSKIPVSSDKNTIPSKKDSCSHKDTTRNSTTGSQLQQQTIETSNHSDVSSAPSDIIPASKGASQSSDKLSPPIIDYRPVMKKKRLALKVKKPDAVGNSVNCELTATTTNKPRGKLKGTKDRETQLVEHIERSSAKNSALELDGNGNSDIEDVRTNSCYRSDDVCGDHEAEVNKVPQMKTQENENDLDSDINSETKMETTTNFQESQENKTKLESQNDLLSDVSDCSDIDDEDNVIPPTPNYNHESSETTANPTSELATRLSKKSVGNPVAMNTETAVENTECSVTIENNKSSIKDGSNNLENVNSCTSAVSQASQGYSLTERQSLSVFYDILNAQKVQPISPLGSTPPKVRKELENSARESQKGINESEEVLEREVDDDQQQLSGQSIEDETFVNNPTLDYEIPMQCSQDSIVEGVLDSENENCSEDDCSPTHNVNSASSLLSSQGEILNTQQRVTAKQEMEKIAQEIQELEAAMKDGKSGEVAEDIEEFTKRDEHFNTEDLSDSENEMNEIEISDDEIGEHQVKHAKTAKQKPDLAAGRSRILRSVIDSDTDEDEQLEEPRDVISKRKQDTSHVDSYVNVLGDVDESKKLNSSKKRGWTSTPPSSNSCLKSPSQSMLHSPRSPSPPPLVSAEVLLKESPQELKEKLNSIDTIMQEYKNSGQKRKRNVIGDASGHRDTTPKRPRVDETRQPNTAHHASGGLHIEYAPVKVEKNYSFVATGLSRSELKEVERLAQKSGFPFASIFNNNTTHVIVRTDSNLVCERTLKYFLGIAGKKWVISFKWIQDSLKAGYLLPEEEYEVVGDVASGTDHHGPKQSRMQKTSLLRDYDVCCIGEFTMLTKEQLTQLLELTGVTKVSHPTMFSFNQNRKAVIIAQSDADQEPINFQGLFRKFKVPVISREWILDSIAPSVIQALDDYLLCDVPEHILEKY